MILSSVAQWQSNRLLTDRSLVRIQPGEQIKKAADIIFCGFFNFQLVKILYEVIVVLYTLLFLISFNNNQYNFINCI